MKIPESHAGLGPRQARGVAAELEGVGQGVIRVLEPRFRAIKEDTNSLKKGQEMLLWKLVFTIVVAMLVSHLVPQNVNVVYQQPPASAAHPPAPPSGAEGGQPAATPGDADAPDSPGGAPATDPAAEPVADPAACGETDADSRAAQPESRGRRDGAGNTPSTVRESESQQGGAGARPADGAKTKNTDGGGCG